MSIPLSHRRSSPANHPADGCRLKADSLYGPIVALAVSLQVPASPRVLSHFNMWRPILQLCAPKKRENKKSRLRQGCVCTVAGRSTRPDRSVAGLGGGFSYPDLRAHDAAGTREKGDRHRRGGFLPRIALRPVYTELTPYVTRGAREKGDRHRLDGSSPPIALCPVHTALALYATRGRSQSPFSLAAEECPAVVLPAAFGGVVRG